MRGRSGWGVALMAAISACTAVEAPPREVVVSMDALEPRLAESATPLHLPFRAEAGGAAKADLTGDLFLGAEGGTRLQAEGPSRAGPRTSSRSPTAHPRVRRQGVDFPQGRMDVVERCPTLALEAVLPDSLFTLPDSGTHPVP